MPPEPIKAASWAPSAEDATAVQLLEGALVGAQVWPQTGAAADRNRIAERGAGVFIFEFGLISEMGSS